MEEDRVIQIIASDASNYEVILWRNEAACAYLILKNMPDAHVIYSHSIFNQFRPLALELPCIAMKHFVFKCEGTSQGTYYVIVLF